MTLACLVGGGTKLLTSLPLSALLDLQVGEHLEPKFQACTHRFDTEVEAIAQVSAAMWWAPAARASGHDLRGRTLSNQIRVN